MSARSLVFNQPSLSVLVRRGPACQQQTVTRCVRSTCSVSLISFHNRGGTGPDGMDGEIWFEIPGVTACSYSYDSSSLLKEFPYWYGVRSSCITTAYTFQPIIITCTGVLGIALPRDVGKLQFKLPCHHALSTTTNTAQHHRHHTTYHLSRSEIAITYRLLCKHPCSFSLLHTHTHTCLI
jgi:hypothetical protein